MSNTKKSISQNHEIKILIGGMGGGLYTYNLNEFHRSFSYFYLNFQMVQKFI